MIRGVWKKLAVLLVALAATLYVQDSLSHITLESEAWSTMCTITKECDGVSPPVVVVSSFIFGMNQWVAGAAGLYWHGEKYVYVQGNMEAAETFVVMVHEMAHYLNSVRGVHQVACENEAYAFAVGDIAAISIGRGDLVRGDSWRTQYRGCELAS